MRKFFRGGGVRFRWTCHRRGEPREKRLGTTGLYGDLWEFDVVLGGKPP